MENNLVKSLNKIKSTINENDQVVWACQASTKTYEEASNKLTFRCDQLTKEIARMVDEIKEFQPQVEILEKCVDVQNETLKISQQSLLTHRLYKKCVEEKLTEFEKEADTLVQDYSKKYQLRKEELERTNPMYKTLEEKRTELQKCKIECLILQQKISQRKQINEQKHEIQRKLFYSDMVSFAAAWLRRDRILREFEEVKQKEKECMIRLLEIKESFKMKQKMGYSRKDNKVPRIEFPKNNVKNDTAAMPGKNQINDLKLFEKSPTTNPFYELTNLLEEKKCTLPDTVKTDSRKTLAPSNYQQKTEFNSTHSKVRILENKIITPPSVQAKPIETLTKEERGKAIEAKLQKVVRNFNRNLSRRHSQHTLKTLKSDLQNGKITDQPQEEKLVPMEGVENSNSQKETGATQDLANLKILSQDMNENVLNLISQESTNNPESTLKKFKYSPERKLSLLNKQDSTQEEKTGGNLFGMTSLRKSQNVPKSPIIDTKNNQEFLQRTTNNSFKKSEAATFLKTPHFTMKSGANPFRSPFASEKHKQESNNFSGKPGTNNHPFKSNSAPLDVLQNLRNDVNNVFKKPTDTGVVFANQEQAHVETMATRTNNALHSEEKSVKPSEFNDENDFFNMGGQYNFGNVTQFSQNLNESVDYETVWSPPEADFAKSPPTENAIFSFGKSSTGFEIKF
nr:uncharacterized protein LOC111517062 isoform X1 [Leptinotarsa decemlineata]